MRPSLKLPYRYCVYGLNLQCQWPLALHGFEGPEQGQLEIALYEQDSLLSSDQTALIAHDPARWYDYASLSDGSTYLRWPDLFEFLISADGRHIACHATRGSCPEALQSYLLSQVLSFALLNQNVEQLHGTAVVIDGTAVAFVGDCGYGKSSLAASFLQLGHRLLTDDLLLFKEQSQRIVAYPGPSRIKLFPETAASIFGKRITGTRMHNHTTKILIPLGSDRISLTPAPIGAIYCISAPSSNSRRTKVTIRRLSQRKALLELLRNTFNSIVVDHERLKNQFFFTTKLASRVTVKSISYPRVLSALPSVRDAILSDVARIPVSKGIFCEQR